MNIVFITPEVLPFVRVGGLAEVSHDLSLALARMGHSVDIITPFCRGSLDCGCRVEHSGIDLDIPISWRTQTASIHHALLKENVRVHLVGNEHFFDREGLYGNAFGEYEDNAERFIFFCRASLELILALGRRPDVIHVNDWTTALIPLFMKTLYRDQDLFRGAATLLTIHNMGSQGIFWHYDMPLTGLGWEYFTKECLEFYGKMNCLKAGILYADMLSTVSPRYAREMLTPENGRGLEGVLQQRAQRLGAVINGVDNQAWDPATDPILASRYSVDDVSGKEICKKDLLNSFGLPYREGKPLISFLGRLLDRRGLEIILPGLHAIMEMGADIAIMGFGEDHYHTQLKDMVRNHPDSMGLYIGYDMDLAHKIVAGSDMMLMPSRSEPCGLHQMHAMRYGTAPIVRATGGLDDTVMDHTSENPGVGFKFEDFTSSEMLEAVKRALTAHADREEWLGLVKRAMSLSFSWREAAPRYVELYQRALRFRARAMEA